MPTPSLIDHIKSLTINKIQSRCNKREDCFSAWNPLKGEHNAYFRNYLFIIFMCIYIYIYMYLCFPEFMYIMCMQCPKRPEEGIRFPETRVRIVSDLSKGYWN